MEGNLSIFVFTFLFGFLFNFIITKIFIYYSYTLGLIDYPNQRKMHTDSMPVVGGLSIFVTVFSASLILHYLGIPQIYFSIQEIVILYLSSLVIVVTGLVDDIKGLGPFNKFLFQIIASLLFLVGFDLHFESLFGFDYTYIDFIINIFFIVGIINAFNLIDGLDGLAGGVSLIICLTLSILYYLSGSELYALFYFILISGCLSSFLIFNITPAKTFLGDTGSLFLGWAFAVSSVYYFDKVSISLSILLPFMIMGLPAFDVIFVMLSRFTKRHKYNIPISNRVKLMFKPDNTHLHHLFIRGGMSKFKTVILLYFITCIGCLACLVSWFNREQVNFLYGIIFVLLFVFLLRLYNELKIKGKI